MFGDWTHSGGRGQTPIKVCMMLRVFYSVVVSAQEEPGEPPAATDDDPPASDGTGRPFRRGPFGSTWKHQPPAGRVPYGGHEGRRGDDIRVA